MQVFRRWILALAGVTLFAGLASAQAQNPFTCSVNNSVPPTLRTEGLTELTGDIVLVCTGGTPLANGSLIPQATFQIFFAGPVTSRLLSTSNNASEAVLMIDEPGSGLTNYGAGVTQTACTTPLSGCIEYVGFSTANGGAAGGVAVNTSTTTALAPGAPAPNMFQGVVSGNSISFNGIPVQPPVSAGANRVFRITNIRVNAQTISGGSASVIPVNAQVSISGSTSIAVSNSVLVVGYIEPGLGVGTGLRNSTNTGGGGTAFAQCVRQTVAFASIVQFTENFTTAFKTRGTLGQNIPGSIYNTESDFTTSLFTGTTGSYTTTAGLADYATRLKAAFTNVPAGVSIFVSSTNITNTQLGQPTTGNSLAQAVIGESQSDGFSGAVPFLPPTQTIGNATGNPAQIGLIQVPLTTVANGTQTGAAVWEVTATNPQSIDTLDFGVWISYTPNTTAANGGIPTIGSMSVYLSYAPTEAQGAYTLAAGGAASATLPIPRFANAEPLLTEPYSFASVSICQTALLFPFVTNQNGFDTGLAIANTSLDPFGTSPQAGGCTLNWYSGGSATPAATPSCTTTPTAPNCVPSIAAGSVYTGLASTIVNGFQGYMIAVCNFQYAHGFAFISDLGARNLAMGYLALVMPNPGSARTASYGCSSASGSSPNCGENLGN